MKQFTKSDIENMLNKIEKTDPSFNKGVVFPIKRPYPVRKRNIRRYILVACLVALSVVVVSVIAIPGVSTMPNYTESSPNISGQLTASGLNSSEESYVYNSSYDFSDFPDEERSTAGADSDSSDNYETSRPVIEPVAPEVNYPRNPEVFLDDVISVGQSVEDYFALNPFEYLGGKIRLNVYDRTPCDYVYFSDILSKINNLMGTEFVIADDGILSDFSNITFEDRQKCLFELGKYGDWELILYDTESSSIFNSSESAVLKVKDFLHGFYTEESADVFLYDVIPHSNGCIVYVKNLSGTSDPVSSNMPIFVFEFGNVASGVSGKWTLNKISYNAPGISIGEFRTMMYDAAVIELLEQTSSDFVILGYDVRYITHATESSVCPYYAFVVRIDPYKDNSYITTVFVPAIEEAYI